MGITLEQLARSETPTSRAAAALIEAGAAPTTRVTELTAGSVTRTLAEALAHELTRLHAQLGEVYEGAFVETETGASLERLLDGLQRPRPWWHLLWHRLRR